MQYYLLLAATYAVQTSVDVSCAFREELGFGRRRGPSLAPTTKWEGKLIRLGSRFGRRNDSSVEIIWRACRHNVI